MTTAPIALNIGQEAHRLGSLTKDEQDSLEKAVMRILSLHVGQENIISGARFLGELQAQGFHLSETRPYRDVINQKRKEGWLIGSTGGKNGGYWLCKDRIEYNQFVKVQIVGFYQDLINQKRAMTRAANLFFGGQLCIYDAPSPEEVDKTQARRAFQAKVRRNFRNARGEHE